MKHLHDYSFEVNKDSNCPFTLRVYVEEYVTFYSVTFFKRGCLHPSVRDFRVKKHSVSSPRAAFEFVLNFYIGHKN